MRLWHIFGGITVSIALAGCTNLENFGSALRTDAPVTSIVGTRTSIATPAVSGTVNLRQNIALPPNAVLTVTVSDASASDAAAKVITQHVVRTNGQQAPFRFVLPYNALDVRPGARILLSAAIAINNRVVLITENLIPVISNGVNNADLMLVPVASAAASAQSSGMLHSTQPAPVIEGRSPASGGLFSQ
ncbi:YbaY family lipoprotein [Musicola paradisiaca]|uniref:Lipoprotein n=1 Tax=Musicola paradisiaca (strain Ech703) TaxID=579405 RepID=C6CBM6_MUSP7|nr:YbaY family lipoprotein [Musicola paradisiaca]ACS84811.1 lipoprotein [Musicola paradisiaca Ech703]